MKKYRVIQWATGTVGSASLKGILRHPQLELVGVKVYDEKKEGMDAGELVGAERTGVIATRDVDDILALDADCLIYCPMPWHVPEMCRILEAGVHLITPCPYWYPFLQIPEETKEITAACRRGNVNFHASGTNPGGIAERFPLMFSGWCNRIDKITMTESGDCRAYASQGVTRELMDLGKTLDEAKNNPFNEFLARSWYQTIDMVAEGLGSEVVEYEALNDYVLAAEDIETASGVIEKGTIGLRLCQHTGRTREGTEIVQRQYWYMDDPEQTRLEKKSDVPASSGWRIEIDGDINLVVDIDFSKDLPQEVHVEQGLSTTGFHLVNAVPLVCDAPDPGIKTYLDLPMITGCMGTHVVER